MVIIYMINFLHNLYIFVWIQHFLCPPLNLFFLIQNSLITNKQGIFSSPEHEVLMVSYCGQSMSVVRRPLCGVNNCFKSLLLQHPWAN